MPFDNSLIHKEYHHRNIDKFIRQQKQLKKHCHLTLSE